MKRKLQVVAAGAASAASGSSDAESRGELLQRFYRAYGGSVFGRCRYLLKDDALAEDAMQDVFAKALINLSAFRAEASPLTWLMKIATNHCLNLIRGARAPWHRAFEDHEAARAAHVLEDQRAFGPRLFEDRESVRRLLAGVDLETQAAAIHYYVDEMTLEEVAALLGRSVPTVRKRLESFVAHSGAENES